MDKTVYPEDYDDEMKAVYDDLYSRGRQLIGKKLNENDEFLLDLSAKITINKWKGYDNGLSQEEVDKLKELHKSNMSGTFETPPELFYDGLMRTEDGKVTRHPLDIPQEEVFEKNQTPPKDVQVPTPCDDDVDVKILTEKVDEMLEVN